MRCAISADQFEKKSRFVYLISIPRVRERSFFYTTS